MLANSVSPPASGVSFALKYRCLRGPRIEHLIGVPDLAECPGIAFLLDDLEDIRMLVHASHEGVMVDLAETPGECNLLLGRERLAAEEDHQMLEPGGFYFLESFIVKECEIDAGDLGTERACDGLDFDPPIGCHGLAPRARANDVTISRFDRAVCDKLGLAWAGASGQMAVRLFRRPKRRIAVSTRGA
jgi:hypothetical protein